MVAASFATPAIVTVMALVAEISIYFVDTMKKAKDPPISMSKQLRMTCQGLSKYEFFWKSLQGSSNRDSIMVAMAITGVTWVIMVIGFSRPAKGR